MSDLYNFRAVCQQAVSPYGRTKLIIEDMFRDLFAAEKDWRIILLRYFNPVGAHPSGECICMAHSHLGVQHPRAFAIDVKQVHGETSCRRVAQANVVSECRRDR